MNGFFSRPTRHLRLVIVFFGDTATGLFYIVGTEKETQRGGLICTAFAGRHLVTNRRQTVYDVKTVMLTARYLAVTIGRIILYYYDQTVNQSIKLNYTRVKRESR